MRTVPTGDAALLQARSRRLPGYRLGPFGLTNGLEQANPQTVGIEAIHVIQDDRFMPVLVSLLVNSKRSGLASDPANLAPDCLTDGAALADTGRAEDHEQIQVPRCKSADILL